MSQEKTAQIIDLEGARAAAAGDGAGPFLEQARLAAGIDVKTVADATKIKPEHIEAIEAGDAAALPATPYAVGFVRVYARFLGLDADAVAVAFREELLAVRRADEPSLAVSAPELDDGDGIKIASLMGVIAVVIFAIWIGFQITGNAQRVNAEGADRPTVRVADTRAEAPRPRAPTQATQEYPVIPVPPVAEAPAATAIVDEAPADATSAGVAPIDAAPANDAPMSDGPAVNGAPAVDALTEPAPVEVSTTPTPAETVASAPQSTAPTPAPQLSAPEPQATQTPEPQSPARPAAEAPPRDATPSPDTATPTTSGSELVRPPVIKDARLKRSVAPDYPNACERRAEPLETVTVVFDVTVSGRPTNARVRETTNACFDASALAAVGRWRFNPKTVDGAPQASRNLEASLNFRR
ncbi:MAG: TonB family protein [Pseudomonadota bacterium]